jgi:DNA polymerase-3 subunit epsilon
VAAATERWLVLDVETTGLDTHRDQLLAIAAVGLRVDWTSRRIVLQLVDSLAITLRPTQVSDKPNILVHGIGAGVQRQGMDPGEALRTFVQWAAGARLVAFHASFDRTLLERYARKHLGQPLHCEWLDIAQLCTVSHPQVKARALDDWLTHFGIQCLARHEATADVMAECDLLQRIWPRVARECSSWRAVQRYAERHAWLGPR